MNLKSSLISSILSLCQRKKNPKPTLFQSVKTHSGEKRNCLIALQIAKGGFRRSFCHLFYTTATEKQSTQRNSLSASIHLMQIERTSWMLFLCLSQLRGLKSNMLLLLLYLFLKSFSVSGLIHRTLKEIKNNQNKKKK